MASAKNATVTSTNMKSSMKQFFLSQERHQRDDPQGTPSQFRARLGGSTKIEWQFKGRGVRNT